MVSTQLSERQRKVILIIVGTIEDRLAENLCSLCRTTQASVNVSEQGEISIILASLRRDLLQGFQRLDILMILKLGIGEVVSRFIRGGGCRHGILKMGNRSGVEAGLGGQHAFSRQSAENGTTERLESVGDLKGVICKVG